MPTRPRPSHARRPPLRDALSGWHVLTPGRGAWWAASAMAVSTGVPLAVGLASGSQQLTGAATFGALAGLYGRAEPHARRVRTQVVAGLGMVLAVQLGAVGAALPLTGALDTVVPALLVALVALVAKLVTDAVRTGPPAGLIPVFAAGALSYQPVHVADLPALALATAVSALFAGVVSALPALRRPDGPERDAVAGAVTAVLQALPTAGSGAAGASARAAAAVHRAWGVLEGSSRAHGPAIWLVHAETVLHTATPGPSPSAVAAPLDAAVDALRGRGPLPPVPPGADDAVDRAAADLRTADGPGRGTALAAALRPRSVLHAPALRVGVAAALAPVLAAAVGFGHPYWAAVGAAAALQSPSAGTTARRALQRSAGTLAGLLLAGLLVPLTGSSPGLWLLVVLTMFGVEFCMPRNYALGTVFITALSLLLTRLGSAGDGTASLLTDRLGDTVLGVLVGLAVALAVRNRQAVDHLTRRLDAVGEASAARDVRALRRDLAALREAGDLVVDDGWRAASPGAGWAPRVEEAERQGYRRLAQLVGAGVRPGRPAAGG